MKFLKLLALVMFSLTFSVFITSCGDKSKAHHTHEMQGKEYTSKYVCPMHCEGSGSETAGQCPVCGMDYVLNENHKKDGHKHEETHTDHSH